MKTIPTTEQMANTQDIPIRDIHLPEPISWWPLAPGWWILLALIIGLIALFWFIKTRKKQQKDTLFSIHQQVMEELQKINQIEDNRLFTQKLSELLKRVAITKYGKKVAGLTGKAWLEFLDTQWNRNDFTQGKGQILLDLPYRRDPQADRKEILQLVKHWLDYQTSKQGEPHV